MKFFCRATLSTDFLHIYIYFPLTHINCPFEKRTAAWEKLVELLPDSYFEQACTEVELAEAPKYAEDITNGQVTGRVVIKL